METSIVILRCRHGTSDVSCYGCHFAWNGVQIRCVNVILHGRCDTWDTLHFTPHTLYTLRFTPETSHFLFRTSHFTLDTPLSTLYTLHSTLHTLYSTLYTLQVHPKSTLGSSPSVPSTCVRALVRVRGRPLGLVLCL